MCKKQISFILALVFAGIMLAPTIISLVDNCGELTEILSHAEDDRDVEEKESQKTLELVNFSSDEHNFNLKDYWLKKSIHFYLSDFKELHKENIYPPPETLT
jgi:hypothetical protein